MERRRKRLEQVGRSHTRLSAWLRLYVHVQRQQHTGPDVALHSGSCCSEERLDPVYFLISARVHLPRREIQFANYVCVFQRTMLFGRWSLPNRALVNFDSAFLICRLTEPLQTKWDILKPAGLFSVGSLINKNINTTEAEQLIKSKCSNMQIWLPPPIIVSPIIWIKVACCQFFWH